MRRVLRPPSSWRWCLSIGTLYITFILYSLCWMWKACFVVLSQDLCWWTGKPLRASLCIDGFWPEIRNREICITSLCDTLRFLGCFTSQKQYLDEFDKVTADWEEHTFHNLLTSNILEPSLDRSPIVVAVQQILLCTVSHDDAGSTYLDPGPFSSFFFL